MKDSIAQFQSLLKSLTAEKAALTARLKAIDAVLSGVSAPAAPAAVSGKRSFSAATKAKMAAAQQARWTKKKGLKAATVKAPKRKMSAAGRAKIAAAAKARWAKVKAVSQLPSDKILK